LVKSSIVIVVLNLRQERIYTGRPTQPGSLRACLVCGRQRILCQLTHLVDAS